MQSLWLFSRVPLRAHQHAPLRFTPIRRMLAANPIAPALMHSSSDAAAALSFLSRRREKKKWVVKMKETERMDMPISQRNDKFSQLARQINAQVDSGKLFVDVHQLFISFISNLVFSEQMARTKEKMRVVQDKLSDPDLLITEKSHWESQNNHLSERYFFFRKRHALHAFHLLKFYQFPNTEDHAILLSLYANRDFDLHEVLENFIQLGPPTKKKTRNLTMPLWRRLCASEPAQKIANQFLQDMRNYQRLMSEHERNPVKLASLFKDFVEQKVKQDVSAEFFRQYLQYVEMLDGLNFCLGNLRTFIEQIDIRSLLAPRLSHTPSTWELPLVVESLSLQAKDAWYPMESISFTKVKMFQRCPMQYFFRYVLAVKMNLSVNIKSITGSALHRAVAAVVMHSKENPGIPEKELVEEARKHYEQEFKDRGIAKEKPHHEVQKEKEIISQYVKRDKKSPNVAVSVEKSFSIRLGDGLPNLIGTYDRIEKDPEGNVIIKEYKTKITEKHELQLHVYSLAYERIHGVRPSKLILESISSGVSREFTLTDEDLTNCENQLRTVVKSIRDGNIIAVPAERNCYTCDYSAICPASVLNISKFDQKRRVNKPLSESN